MAQFASDSFTGSAGTEIGAAWTKRLVTSQKIIFTDASRARSNGVDPVEYYHSGSPASQDYSVSADVYIASTDSGPSAALFARASTGAVSGYFVGLFAGSGLRLYKQSSGSFTQLGSTYAVTLVAGTTRAIKLEVSGTTTTTIKGYLDGVEVLSYSDSSSPITTAGKAGIRIYYTAGTPSDTKYLHLDNFSADDLVSGALGTVAVTSADDSASSSGSAGGGEVAGSVAKTDASDAASASGFVDVIGSVNAADGDDSCAASTAVLDMDLLAEPLYLAHAANKQVWPEESTTAIAATVAAGENFLDLDSQTLSTGEVVLMHDTTVDRTTSGTGAVASKTLADWQALRLDPSTWFGGGYPDTEAPPVLSDILAAYKNTALFSIENKGSSASLTALLNDLYSAGIAANQAVISSFASSQMAAINTAGYRSMFLTTTGAESAATVASYGVDWVGVGTGTSSAQVAAYKAAGLKVGVWTVNRRKDRDTWLSYGVNGIFSDDTKYLGATTALRTADNFASQTWDYGMLASDDSLAPASRGQFFSTDSWGYSSTETTFRGCLMGFLCPVATPTNFVLGLKITFDSANAGDATRWAAVFIGTTDQAYKNDSGTNVGYHILFRKNGSVEIWLKHSGSSGSQIAAQTGTTIADGTERIFRITVTPTQIKAAQIDSGGVDITATTATNSDYRGGYVSLGRAGLASKFREVAVLANDISTGSVSYTNANDGLSASGATTVTGITVVTNLDDGAAISGAVAVTGVASATGGADSIYASGAAGSVSGEVNVTDGGDSVAASSEADDSPGGDDAILIYGEPKKKKRKPKKSIEDILGEAIRAIAKDAEEIPASIYRVKESPKKEIVPALVVKADPVEQFRAAEEEAQKVSALLAQYQAEVKRREFEEDEDLLMLIMEMF